MPVNKNDKFKDDEKKLIEGNSFDDKSDFSTTDIGIIFAVLVVGIILFSFLFKFIF